MKSQTFALCCCLALMSGIAANTVSNNALDCPQICPALYSPVCGTDGFTLKEFSSLCDLKASNCRRERNALTTYAQTDMAWCSSEKVSDIHEQLGNIKLDVNGCMKPCAMIYLPLCVTNGKIRGLVPNECALDMYNCALRANGAQPAEQLRILRPDTC